MTMNDRRQKLIEVFEDTQRFYTENPQLAAAVDTSRKATCLYGPDEYPALPQKREKQMTFAVTQNTSFQAARNRYFDYGRAHRRAEFCFSHPSRWRRKERQLCAGREPVPVLHAISGLGSELSS